MVRAFSKMSQNHLSHSWLTKMSMMTIIMITLKIYQILIQKLRLGLKKILAANEHKISYNFAKKLFEYANGYPPRLNERLELLAISRRKGSGMRDLVTDILVHSITGNAKQKGTVENAKE